MLEKMLFKVPLLAVNVGTDELPLLVNPVAVLLFVQANVAPEGILVNELPR
jgi:hypothetical protein